MSYAIIITTIITALALIYECIHKYLHKRKRKLFWDLMSHCTGNKTKINSICSVLKRNNYKEMKKLLNTLNTNELWEATKDLTI